MPYQMFTDSCSDLPVEYAAKYDVTILPLTFLLDGREYRDDGWKSISMEDFYSRMRKGSMPTTSLINVQTFLDVFTPILREGKDILYIAFSSALSGTCQNGMTAAAELREQFPDRSITVVDSLCASMGLGALVLAAARLREAGMEYGDLVKWLESNKLRLIHWFTVDDLGHLRRGGRLSGASAVLGTILSIKPVLNVNNEGRLVPIDKVRGRRQALRSLVERAAGSADRERPVFISHGDCAEDARDVANMITERIGKADIEIAPIGPVIGSHTGPGVLAVFFTGAARESD